MDTETLPRLALAFTSNGWTTLRGKGDAATLYSSADAVLKGDVFKDSVWQINVGGAAYTYQAGSTVGSVSFATSQSISRAWSPAPKSSPRSAGVRASRRMSARTASRTSQSFVE